MHESRITGSSYSHQPNPSERTPQARDDASRRHARLRRFASLHRHNILCSKSFRPGDEKRGNEEFQRFKRDFRSFANLPRQGQARFHGQTLSLPGLTPGNFHTYGLPAPTSDMWPAKTFSN